jgi:hypothetical protein
MFGISKRRIGRAVLIWLCVAGTAAAETISFSASAPLRRTNWTDSLVIPQFNPSLGQLESIDFDLAATVTGDARFENLNPTPRSVTANLRAMLEMSRPDDTVIQVALPETRIEQVVGGFDGMLDFMGTSGRTYSGLTATVVEERSSPNPVSDLSLFTGNGFVTLPVRATGQSSIMGGGNLAFSFSTHGEAALTITYTYTAVPEPGTLALLLMPALLLGRRSMRVQ